jgi:hypothetical protein
MLFISSSSPYLRNGLLLFMVFLIACAGHAYRVNSRRSNDDPAKRNFLFGAIWLTPITWPVFLLAALTFFIIRVFIYTLVLILFTIGLITFRKPFLFVWLDKIATQIGNKLLDANTFLIKIVLGKKIKNPQAP